MMPELTQILKDARKRHKRRILTEEVKHFTPDQLAQATTPINDNIDADLYEIATYERRRRNDNPQPRKDIP